ncbi:hypothetical protein BDN70DRAFT_989744 [Pholiota conissans]|uniref:DRBM domain-containing protein n=1 Tax=Pholiota conissans TaxID=109636 RepID=A0A9P5ZAV5_9AGAR|nr:hypothetical protein BDN70DRAFT_989744 [Pholiota conissans]
MSTTQGLPLGLLNGKNFVSIAPGRNLPQLSVTVRVKAQPEKDTIDDIRRPKPRNIADFMGQSEHSDVVHDVALTDGTFLLYNQALGFIDYYCRRFSYSQPQFQYELTLQGNFEATMTVNRRRISFGSGTSTESARQSSFFDAAIYLEKEDSNLWKTYVTLVHNEMRTFMEYYCQRYNFAQPDISYVWTSQRRWQAELTVHGRRLGRGLGLSKESALKACYFDAAKYLTSRDSSLWKAYVESS